MEAENNILIAGGGLAGLTCALHLLKAGFQVTLIEKNIFPQHKVCGEYISNEVLPYLTSLDADPGILKPAEISRLQISTVNGKMISCKLPLGGFGISRYAFDQFLYLKALNAGCKILNEKILDISYHNDHFQVKTDHGNYKTKIAIGAFGKRSTLDHKLNRDFIRKRSPWLAVKAHYIGAFDEDLVALHNFKGGYCGISKVENNLVNICYLTQYDEFKKYRNLEDYQQQVLFRNPHLKSIFENCVMDFKSPITIGQISFEKKEAVKDHMLFIGDAAGLIHPLCGNGMAMAIHSAKICAESIIQHSKEQNNNTLHLEKRYTNLWDKHFKSRLAFGRTLSSVLLQEQLSGLALNALTYFPSILPKIVRRTHGKPLTLSDDQD